MNIVVNGDMYVNENQVWNTQKHRSSNEMKTAKQRVKSRDGICQCCEEAGTGGHLQVHHIFSLAEYPELGCLEENMICLCQKCHDKYHKSYTEINPVTFSDFMKRYANRR